MYETAIFYRSYLDAISDLEDERQQAVFLKAIIKYGLDEEEPEFNGIMSTMWKLIKPQIDANHRNFNNGKKGGRPKKDAVKQTETPQKDTKEEKTTQSKGKDFFKEIVASMSKKEIENITLIENEEYANAQECEVLEPILIKIENHLNSDDFEEHEDLYKKIRNHFIKTEHIYSMTYKSGGKRKADSITEEIHRTYFKNLTKDEQREAKFYETFWSKFGGKVVNVDGKDLYCDDKEENFFINGTKKSSEFTTGNIMSKIYKLSYT